MRFSQLETIYSSFASSGTSLELYGPSGIGKTDFVHDQVAVQSARIQAPWGFSKIMGPLANVTDLQGFMVPGRDKKERRVSEFTMPTWFVCENGGIIEDYDHGTLFIDEFGQGEPEVKRAMAELIHRRRLGSWSLPKGWHVVMASNRPKDRSGVTKSYDFIINRRIELDMEADLDSWENWAFTRGVHAAFITFAKKNANIVFANEHPEIQGAWCTPRSLVMTGEQLLAMRGSFIDEKEAEAHGEDAVTHVGIPTSSEAFEVARGGMGIAAGAQLMATIRLANALPEFEEIVANPKTCRVPVEPDARMMATLELAHKAVDKHMAAIVTYVERLDPEFAAMFAKIAVKHRPAVTTHQAFQQLYLRNASLFTAAMQAAR